MTSVLTPSVRSPSSLRWKVASAPSLPVSGSFEMPLAPKANSYSVTIERPDIRANASHAWLSTVYSLLARGESEHAAEMLFDHFDEVIDEEDFVICDGLLLTVDLSRLKDTNALVALLAVTLPASGQLRNRSGIVHRVEGHLKTLVGKERTERLMNGLR